MAKDRKPSEVERDRRNVSRLYLQGKTQMEIAAELKISQPTVSREIKVLAEEWKRERVFDINEAKYKELAKLDLLELEYWDAWKRSQSNAVTQTEKKSGVRTGNKMLGENVETTTRQEKQVGDPRFLDGVRDCVKQRCAILGIEAPKKIEATGKNGEPLNPPPVDTDGFNRSISAFADAIREAVSGENPKPNGSVEATKPPSVA